MMLHAREYFQRELRRLGAALRALRSSGSGAGTGEAGSSDTMSVLTQAARAARASASASSQAAGIELPIEHAARAFELDELVRDALVLAVGVEVDPDTAALVRELGGSPWPTLGLIQRLADVRRETTASYTFAGHIAVRDGLLDLVGDGPLMMRALRVCAELVPVLAGDAPRRDDHLVRTVVDLADLVAPPAAKAELTRWARDTAIDERMVLVLDGAAHSGRRLWAAAACAHARRELVAVELAGDVASALRTARRLARWHRAAVLLRVPPGSAVTAGEPPMSSLPSLLWREVRTLDAPVAIAAERPDADALARYASCDVIRVVVGELPPALRRELWSRLLGGATNTTSLAELAEAFPFRTDQIARASRRAGLAGRRGEPVDAVARAACRDVGAMAVSKLAERLTTPFSRSDLVVPDRVARELDLAIAWARQRVRLLDDWGFGERLAYGRGVTALFAGKPGTGKTMAARVLAGELGAASIEWTSPASSASTSARPRSTSAGCSTRRAPPPRSCCSTRQTPCSASAARFEMRTTAGPTSRLVTCYSGWSNTTA